MYQVQLALVVLAAAIVSGKWSDHGEVCFGSKDDSFGSFSITSSGKFKAIELSHSKGFINCLVNRPQYATLWGCGWHNMKPKIMTVVTTKENAVVFPQGVNGKDLASFKLKGMHSNSSVIAFTNWKNPLRTSEGEEFRIWYTDDLTNSKGERDNSGDKTCAKVRTYIE